MALLIQTGTRYCGPNYYTATDSNWNLLGNSGIRTWATTITFQANFATAPSIQVFVSGFHALRGYAPKFTLSVANVTISNFLLQINTFDDAQIAGVTVGWVAITL